MNARHLFGMILMLYHEEFGQGQPLIICHGFLGSSSNWRSVARMLATQFHVYCVDLRNHGMSFHHSDCSYVAMAQDILEFIHYHRLENPILIGHSMGGKVVMQVAANADLLLSKLVVVDIAPKRYSDRHRIVLDSMSRLALGDMSSVSELDHALRLDIADPVLRGFLLKNCIKNAHHLAWKINLEGLREGYDSISAPPVILDTIDCSTLFVQAERSDYMVLPDDELLIRRYFSEFKIRTVLGAGHWIHIEAQIPFVDLVLDFLCDN